jgi:hypothetical protein
MELPPGRVIAAGDPREREENPYNNQAEEFQSGFDHAARTHFPIQQNQLLHQPVRFHQPNKKRLYDHQSYNYDQETVDRANTRWRLINRAFKQTSGRRPPFGFANNVAEMATKDDEEKKAKRVKQVNDSYYAAERDRRMAMMNQFVGQNVPPTGPFRRSFIPHDLAHMLSPNDA